MSLCSRMRGFLKHTEQCQGGESKLPYLCVCVWAMVYIPESSWPINMWPNSECASMLPSTGIVYHIVTFLFVGCMDF